MQASAEHVQYQLPNEHSRVGFLLEAIQCSDPGLQAAMASIKTDNGPEGMRNNFEATAAHLLPYDPVAKKRSNGQKRGSAQISSVMDHSPTTTKKPSIGKTGVSVKFDDQVNDEEKYIMSMVQAAVTKTLNQKNDQQSKEKPQVTLKSILKHAKNNGSS